MHSLPWLARLRLGPCVHAWGLFCWGTEKTCCFLVVGLDTYHIRYYLYSIILINNAMTTSQTTITPMNNEVSRDVMRQMQPTHKVRRYVDGWAATAEQKVAQRIAAGRAYVAHSFGAGCIYVAFND